MDSSSSTMMTIYRPAVLRTTKPKRRLNAYNFFFSEERKRLLEVLPVRIPNKQTKGHGKIKFEELAQTVSTNWKRASEGRRARCTALANQDKIRFECEMKEYNETQKYLVDFMKHNASNGGNGLEKNAVTANDHGIVAHHYREVSYPPEMNPVHIASLARQLDAESQDILLRVFL